ncbi:MAG: hypothetical protein RIR70_480 [Pseudomonadota bacterium]
MSTIEQAIARLRALRSAGVESPAPVEVPPVSVPAVSESPANAPAAVEIDLAGLHAKGMITPDAPRARINDEFRVIKRPLIDNARGRGASVIRRGNLVMVTSALPGEGKSFSSINLAMSLAQEEDTTVLLVDADVARPSIMRLLGLPPARGLMDVLCGEATVGEVLMKTNVDKLSLISAGMPHERATEMLASSSMRSFLDEIASRYEDRIVVFDSPPLLSATEARVLASHMGQVLLVVEAMRTPAATVKSALATIAACPVKLALLNKGAAPVARGYGYGYPAGKEAYGYGAPL